MDGDFSSDDEDGEVTTKTKHTENVKKRGEKGGYEKVNQEDKMVRITRFLLTLARVVFRLFITLYIIRVRAVQNGQGAT